MFKNNTILITGGTGSFGNAVLDRFLETNIAEIRIFSRDEQKQDDMRLDYKRRFPALSDKIKFYIGDVRDLSSLRYAMHGVDHVFHAAALKQVPSCEFFPLEAVKTNVIGTDNVLTTAIEAGVMKVICLSTDKAAYPVNAMGTSKAMMEKVAIAKSRTVCADRTMICCTRYGKILCSRGSIIPILVGQIKEGRPLTITDPDMTRFVMSQEEAVELVVFAFKKAETGDIIVQKAPAYALGVMAQALLEIFHADNKIQRIGIRHGEIMYEHLLTSEEYSSAEDMGKYLRVPMDKQDLDYARYYTCGDTEKVGKESFNSNNAQRLDVEEMKEKLLSLCYIQNQLATWRR